MHIKRFTERFRSGTPSGQGDFVDALLVQLERVGLCPNGAYFEEDEDVPEVRHLALEFLYQADLEHFVSATTSGSEGRMYDAVFGLWREHPRDWTIEGRLADASYAPTRPRSLVPLPVLVLAVHIPERDLRTVYDRLGVTSDGEFLIPDDDPPIAPD